MPLLLKPRHSVNESNIPSSSLSSKGKRAFTLSRPLAWAHMTGEARRLAHGIVRGGGAHPCPQPGRGRWPEGIGMEAKWAKTSEKQQVWLSNLATAPDPTGTEITRKGPRPALAKEAGGGKALTLDASWQACSLITPPLTNPWFQETLSYETSPRCLLPFLLLATILRPPLPPQPVGPSDLWISWAPPKINVFGCRFLYLENGPLVFSSLCTILLQGWFVVVFSAIFTNSSKLSLRERCFLQVSHSAFMAQIIEIPLGYAGARLCASHFYVHLIKCIYFPMTKLSWFQSYQGWNTIPLVIPYVWCLTSCFSVFLQDLSLPQRGTFSFLFSCSFLPF